MSFNRAIKQGNFDSVLELAEPWRSAKLTIRLKVALFPRDPASPANPAGMAPPVHLAASMAHVHQGQVADYNNTPVKCRSWLVPEWNKFKIRFKQMVELGWNNQMILLPVDKANGGGMNDQDRRQLVSNPRIPPHVECALDVELMPSQLGSHAQIEVVRLAQAHLPFRNFMRRITNESVEFKRRVKDKWSETTLYQITAAHEVGHWLREPGKRLFEHVDAQHAKTLPAAQRADAQYGHVLSKRVALMGSGNVATAHEAKPWLSRIGRHVSAPVNWTMMHRIHFRRQHP
jgi:hypothetical protein